MPDIVRTPGAAPGVLVRRFRVKSESNDYLTCRTWDGTDEGTVDVKVAKPYLLRRTPFDFDTVIYPNGQEIAYIYSEDYERLANDGVDAEIQVMTPRYFVDEELTAISVLFGGTGVDECPWVDLNTAGRHWAKEA